VLFKISQKCACGREEALIDGTSRLRQRCVDMDCPRIFSLIHRPRPRYATGMRMHGSRKLRSCVAAQPRQGSKRDEGEGSWIRRTCRLRPCLIQVWKHIHTHSTGYQFNFNCFCEERASILSTKWTGYTKRYNNEIKVQHIFDCFK
jgi:hypothetical protein